MTGPKSTSIKVPFGLDTLGAEVLPHQAQRRGLYRCPDCKGELIPKLGSKRQHHFAHKVDPEICDFRYETLEHFRAKEIIVKAINEGQHVRLRRTCRWCASRREAPLPLPAVSATTEFTLSTGHRADVALFDVSGSLVGVIEVLLSHAVDDAKMRALEKRQIPWVEIHALDVIAAQEAAWPVGQDHFPEACCPSCSWQLAGARERIRLGIENRSLTFLRACPACKAPCVHRLPHSVHSVVFDFHLPSEQMAFAAFLDADRKPLALVYTCHHAEFEGPRYAALGTTGIPWSTFLFPQFATNGDRPELELIDDHFRPFECAACQEKREALEAEKERQLEEERLRIEHTAPRPFMGAWKLDVGCPIPQHEQVTAVDRCPQCYFFLQAIPGAIVCWGGSHAEASRQSYGDV